MCGGMCVTRVFEAFKRNPKVLFFENCYIHGEKILFFDTIDQAVENIIDRARNLTGRWCSAESVREIIESQDTDCELCYLLNIDEILCRK